MFGRFTQEARQTLYFARANASERMGDAIDIEDILQGIIAAAPDAVRRFASHPSFMSPTSEGQLRPGETPEQWHQRVEDTAWFRDGSRELPFSTRVKAALEHAAGEADELRHKAIRPEHLLMGLLRDEGTEAWQTLNEAGVTLRELRQVLAEEGVEERSPDG